MKTPFSQKTTAKLVGLFFILGTLLLFIGQSFYGPIINSPNYLETAYPNRITVITGILVEFAGYIGLIFIPILSYPFLKIYNQTLALGYISLRLFEVVTLTFAQVLKLSIIGLSQNYLASGGDLMFFHNMGNMIHSILYWVDSGGLIYIIVFVIGALIFYYQLYRTKLIPRWLSIWGLLSAFALLVASFTFTLGISTAEFAILLMIPLAVQEQVMALWLIRKGFKIPDPVSESTK